MKKSQPQVPLITSVLSVPIDVRNIHPGAEIIDDTTGSIASIAPTIPPEINRGKIISEAKFPPPFFGLFCVRFEPKANYFVAGFGQGAIQVRYFDSGELKRTIRSGGNRSFPVMCARFHPIFKDVFYTGSSCGNIFQCNGATGDYVRFAEEANNEINALDITREGGTIITGGKDSNIRVYDSLSGQLKHTYDASKYTDPSQEQRFHHQRVFALKFHPRTWDVFLSGGWDDYVRIWDIRDSTGCVRKIRGPHICGDAIDIHDKVVVTGSWVVSSSLQTWDFMSGNLIADINPRNRPRSMLGEYLYACQYFDGDSSDDLVAVGGSGTGYMEVISIKDNLIHGAFKAHKPCQTLDTFQNRIVYGGMEPAVRIVDFT